MEKVEIRFLEHPPKVPVLVCGMPDTGYVGRLAPFYLKTALGAKLVAELYSEYLPPQVKIDKEGIASLLKGEFFWSGKKANLLIFTGDAQATTVEGQHIISEKVLEMAQQLGVKKVFTLGAFITGSIVENPEVFGTATSPELLKVLQENGVKTMSEGNITGMNGLLFGLAKVNGMDGIGLYGATSGFAADPNAARAILNVLEKMLNLTLDYSAIKEEREAIEFEEDAPPKTESKEESQKKVREYIT